MIFKKRIKVRNKLRYYLMLCAAIRRYRHKPDNITLSIILPAFNVEFFLRQCLDSLFLQDSPLSFECIILNDGSSDKTLSIALSYAKKFPTRITVVNQKNFGAGNARNKGLEISQGHYVWFVDTDDFMPSDALKKIDSMLKKFPDTDITIFRYATLRPKKSPMSFNDVLIYQAIGQNHVFSLSEHPSLLYMKPNLWNKIFRRSFLIQNNLYCQETPIANDNFLMFTSLLLSKSIVLSEHVILNHRVDRGGNSISAITDEKNLIVLDVIESCLKFAESHNFSLDFVSYFFIMQLEVLLWRQERTNAEIGAKIQTYIMQLVDIFTPEAICKKWWNMQGFRFKDYKQAIFFISLQLGFINK